MFNIIKKSKFKLCLPLVSIATLVASTPGNTAGNLYKSGAYTGASVGYTYMNTKVNDNMHVPDYLTDNKGSKAKKHSISGGLFAGYRHFLANGWLGGIEVELAKDNASFSKKFQLGDLTNKLTLKSSYKFVPTLILGKQLHERWLGFIKVGISCVRFKGSHSVKDPDTDEKTEKFKAKKTGLVLGAGAEYAHNAHLSTIATVSYEHFGKINRNYNKITDDNGEKNTGAFKPSYVTAKIGLAYRF